MRFTYLRLASASGAHTPRPYLKTMVTGPLGQTPIVMLVDSGADETMMPGQVAAAIGIEPTGEIVRLTGFGLEVIEAQAGEARFTFGKGASYAITSRVLFHDAITLPAFGHRAFFNRCRVTFDAGAGIFQVVEPARHLLPN